MELQRYSRLIYDLYTASRTLPSAAFQAWAIARLRDDLPFASAWWGVATTVHAGETVLHSAGYGTRREFTREIEAIKDVDDVRERTLNPPGVTVLKSGYSTDRVLRRFDARHDLHSILATAVPDSSGKLVQFISLYRPEGARPFTEAERAAKEALVPHLMRAWETNWDAVPALDSAPPAALLSVDGAVIHADDRFRTALRAAWPNWCGKRLVLRDGGFDGPRSATAAVTITAVPGGAPGMQRVLLRPGGNGALTGRERAVAAHYADGLSYKEIAKALGIMPDTVRSYIKTCYTKLAVRNKVQLQQALCRPGPHAPAPGGTVSPRAPSM